MMDISLWAEAEWIAAIAVVVLIVFLAIGLILDSINHHDRRRFELDVLRGPADA